jgi:hypothetical protein
VDGMSGGSGCVTEAYNKQINIKGKYPAFYGYRVSSVWEVQVAGAWPRTPTHHQPRSPVSGYPIAERDRFTATQ